MKSLLKKLAVVSFGLLSCVVVKVGAGPFDGWEKALERFQKKYDEAVTWQNKNLDKSENWIDGFTVTADIPEEFLKKVYCNAPSNYNPEKSVLVAKIKYDQEAKEYFTYLEPAHWLLPPERNFGSQIHPVCKNRQGSERKTLWDLNKEMMDKYQMPILVSLNEETIGWIKSISTKFKVNTGCTRHFPGRKVVGNEKKTIQYELPLRLGPFSSGKETEKETGKEKGSETHEVCCNEAFERFQKTYDEAVTWQDKNLDNPNNDIESFTVTADLPENFLKEVCYLSVDLEKCKSVPVANFCGFEPELKKCMVCVDSAEIFVDPKHRNYTRVYEPTSKYYKNGERKTLWDLNKEMISKHQMPILVRLNEGIIGWIKSISPEFKVNEDLTRHFPGRKVVGGDKKTIQYELPSEFDSSRFEE